MFSLTTYLAPEKKSRENLSRLNQEHKPVHTYDLNAVLFLFSAKLPVGLSMFNQVDYCWKKCHHLQFFDGIRFKGSISP